MSEFEYFYAGVSESTVNLAAIADMPDNNHVGPLAVGSHELAVVSVTVAGDTPLGTRVEMLFFSDSLRGNFIADSTGYLVVEPVLVNGAVLVETPTTVADESRPPLTFTLGSNFPNPFNGVTSIDIELHEAGQARLEVYDIGGRLISILNDSFLRPGVYSFSWRGVSDSGQQLPSGVYFYRLSLNGSSATKKMCLVK